MFVSWLFALSSVLVLLISSHFPSDSYVTAILDCSMFNFEIQVFECTLIRRLSGLATDSYFCNLIKYNFGQIDDIYTGFLTTGIESFSTQFHHY